MFITLCVGLLLRRSNIVPPESFRHLSTMAFHSLLPCIVFYNVHTADLSTAAQPQLMLFLLVFLLTWYTLNYIFFRKREPNPRRQGALIQNAYRSNIAVVGVSLAQNMMSQDGLAALAIAISMMVPLYNMLAVFTLETCRGGKLDPKHTVLNILRNPMILGCLLGFFFQFTGLRLPAPVERAVSNFSTAGSVVALLSLGASLEFSGLRKNASILVTSCVYRLIITPLLAIVAAGLMGFRGDSLGVVLICVSTPLAAASYPMAIAYDSDHELTSQLVVCTSLLCSLTLFLWVFILKQLGVL